MLKVVQGWCHNKVLRLAHIMSRCFYLYCTPKNAGMILVLRSSVRQYGPRGTDMQGFFWLCSGHSNEVLDGCLVRYSCFD